MTSTCSESGSCHLEHLENFEIYGHFQRKTLIRKGIGSQPQDSKVVNLGKLLFLPYKKHAENPCSETIHEENNSPRTNITFHQRSPSTQLNNIQREKGGTTHEVDQYKSYYETFGAV